MPIPTKPGELLLWRLCKLYEMWEDPSCEQVTIHPNDWDVVDLDRSDADTHDGPRCIELELEDPAIGGRHWHLKSGQVLSYDPGRFPVGLPFELLPVEVWAAIEDMSNPLEL